MAPCADKAQKVLAECLSPTHSLAQFGDYLCNVLHLPFNLLDKFWLLEHSPESAGATGAGMCQNAGLGAS